MRNKYIELDDHVVVFIRWKDKQLEMSIDKNDFQKILPATNVIHAQYNHKTRSYYAIFKIKRKSYQVHRFIFDPMQIEGKVIDHKNHNTLDNRRSNLSPCSNSENAHNRLGPNNNNKTSGIRGIHWDKQYEKWRVAFAYKKQRINVGRFDCLEDANQAYIKRMEELENA